MALEKVTLGKSITSGLRKAMEEDPKVVLIGEDIGKLGGVFRITEGLQKDFGEERVIDSPLAESGIVGTAVGHGPARLPAGVRDPVRRLRLPGLRPDRQPGRQDARPLARRHQDPDGHPHPVRRRHRQPGAPLREPRGLLRPHGRAARRRLHQPGGRALDDPAGRSRATTRSSSSSPSGATTTVPSTTRLPRDSAARTLRGQRDPRGHRRDAARLRPRRQDDARVGRRSRGRGHEHRGHRPALALAAADRHHRVVRAQDGPARRRARGEQLPRHGLGDLGAGHRAVLLRARGPGHPGRRRQHPVSAEPDGGGVPPRPRPDPRRRRPRPTAY